jgi:predicted NAD/FAD-binding protein
VVRTAVIGAGVSGLTAAYALSRTQGHEVVLLEADSRLGGHAHTHDVRSPSGRDLAVDSGFIVHNERTYPVLLRLFRELGVSTSPTEMSMSVSCEGCGLEYAGARQLPGLFAQPRRALQPSYLRMLTEVPRFHRLAKEVLATSETGAEEPLRAFLARGRFSQYFVDHFAIPVVACVWSCPPAAALDYPARYLFSFLANHGMLSVSGSPEWRVVVGGSRTYVEKVAATLGDVRLSAPVRSVERHADTIEIRDGSDQVHTVDQVLVATHPDQALSLLADPTREETDVLGTFTYSRNETLLHRDRSIMPASEKAHASWNYRTSGCGAAADRVIVTYDMERLQHLGDAAPHLVTLNAVDRIDPATVIAAMAYEHPNYTLESIAAQRRLPSLNDGRTAFAGAYHGWGFHEDGARAGLAAARSLGASW